MCNDLLANKVSIVTGASRGIGREIALTLSQQGATVVLCGRNVDLLRQVKEEIDAVNGRAIVVSGDVTQSEVVVNIIKKTIKEFNKIDILVNNAGINKRSTTLETTIEDWKSVLDVNLNAAFYFSKAVLPHMIERKEGKIINISSRASKSPHKNATPAYGASKAALNYLTKHLAMEYARDNIYVNGICPGPIDTDMTKQWTNEFKKRTISNIPLQKLGKPKDIANTVLFLASDSCEFITGETINVNGGVLMD